MYCLVEEVRPVSVEVGGANRSRFFVLNSPWSEHQRPHCELVQWTCWCGQWVQRLSNTSHRTRRVDRKLSGTLSPAEISLCPTITVVQTLTAASKVLLHQIGVVCSVHTSCFSPGEFVLCSVDTCSTSDSFTALRPSCLWGEPDPETFSSHLLQWTFHSFRISVDVLWSSDPRAARWALEASHWSLLQSVEVMNALCLTGGPGQLEIVFYYKQLHLVVKNWC